MNKRKRVTVVFPEELHEKLKKKTKRIGMSMNTYILLVLQKVI
ncbi:hypothetical protein [Ligilactobacillus salivarius]|uniref:Arc-like DNA binding domain-containing protein n=1 Tax=Ligilactobacillus salivarius cp400 TaxID=1273133 RepID=V6DKW5_9LACO|nr:hypothetical protein [Ligilactobacillus salivarius]CDK34276.1 hypothetical protein LSCP400_00731 [Ligilactobacillus salivarius cp400]